jgi:Protein of unknown function (DUF2752)
MTRPATIYFVSAAVIGVSLLYFFYPVGSAIRYPPCPFHAVTGFYCPGCGSQRALSALVHGHLFTAVDYNLLMVISLPLLGYHAIETLLTPHSGGKLLQIAWLPRVILMVVVVFTVLRNLPFPGTSWLAP